MGRIAATRWMFLVAALLPATLVAATAGVPPPVADWLHEAEEVRSSQPARLAALLVKLEAATASASPGQREQVAYLRAYSDAYSGRYANALAGARNRVAPSQSPVVRVRARALIVTTQGLSRHFTEGLRALEVLHESLDAVQADAIRRTA